MDLLILLLILLLSLGIIGAGPGLVQASETDVAAETLL